MTKLAAATGLLGFCVAITSCFAQKVTVDPNVPRPGVSSTVAKPQPYDPAKDSDMRMTQKVSYEAHHARLSAITSELSRLTGVPITCGRSKNDWQSRDVPVTMYMKDMPLGTLLRAIACATHNIVKLEKTETSTFYRIYQDPKLTRQFAEYDKAKAEYRTKMLAWNWDSMAAVKDIPLSEIKPYENDLAVAAANVSVSRALSALLTALGPDYKQRVLAGEPVSLDPKSIPSQLKAPLMDTLGAYDRLRIAYDMRGRSATPNNIWASDGRAPLTAGELGDFKLIVVASDDSYPNISATVGGQIGLGIPISAYGTFRLLHPERIKRPQQPTPPRIGEQTPYDLDFSRVKGDTPAELKIKLDLSDLAKTKGLNYAAVIAEAAKRAGFSMVMEDWDYFKEYPNSPQQWLTKDVDFYSIFRSNYAPRVRLADKVVIPFWWDWTNKHESLAPASVVDTLVAKLAGNGVDLEDLLPVMVLPQPEWDEWVNGSKDLGVLYRQWSPIHDPLWPFFASLSPEERSAAALPEGLSLAGFDPAVLSDLFKQYARFHDRQMMYSSYKPGLEMPDEQTFAQMVLRLRSNSGQFYSSYTGVVLKAPEGKVVPKGLDQIASYRLELSGPSESGSQVYATASGPRGLPFYSKEREEQLIKALDMKPPTSTAPLPIVAPRNIAL